MPEQNVLQAILAGWREWPLPINAPPKLLGPIPGGRTNRNFKVIAPGFEQPLVLRINNQRGRYLGIDRKEEAQIAHTVAQAGIAPEPIFRDPSQRFALLPFIEARTWNGADFANPIQRKRLLQALKKVQALNPATTRRSYLAYLNHYWTFLNQAQMVDAELTDQWLDFLPKLQAFDQAGWYPKLTHHDMIPENVLDTGSRLYLIDWEYAAIGHPDIDLWSISPSLVTEPFIHELASWTNDLWERVQITLRHHRIPTE
ncbi:choline/ethanolamine kinase family protein [Gilvimarinus sp. SDUM040013]|uniref:Choline/ethanolamine kinase family protein n=1 Tax=Gilvimarinus gilvus TaxID=3058038 RepID=A0ABU4S215_9GAMM|nr:choline/ethanolamine kinase family protein [Gilvimarinus sp. SDUM040013]MDO3388061.1 choline/ethanolamine kinase family protein [Gilvimarinus sp. SDUM040013]MDX6850969.1 choline/ethanolamine kinase family protein [Gilvimarinus sp. SDUM040013]